MIGFVSLMNDSPGSGSAGSGKTHTLLDVGLNIGPTSLKVTNRGSPEAAGILVDARIDSPTGHKIAFYFPALGGSVSLNLNDFVETNGERFDPYRRKVRQIWIGGGGYDYQAFTAP